MYSEIDKNVSKYVSFTKEELSIFHSVLEIKTISKKEYLLQEGDICDFEAFVVKGCLRKFYINEDGNEVIVQFAIEDSWISDIASFCDRKPSLFFIETLEDCELLIFTPKNKEALLSQVPKFERVFRILVQRNLSVTQNRLVNTIVHTAPERYLDFLEHYPTLSQRVAQHYIASYLGISAEFLSKVRKRLPKF
ncbi:Crp/Fnr family transcriptional regulator [Mariniflexile gromovii]|uniref:Crp/Fnr family transcriptional regulator n=1 Tax=Mariniflexile gromovii TaxID=362523 RepID=A0ABS4BUM1_9FLAO|nr:Crp/Fnr family transcriptional regulator [Mariniflexile gromovii]MBP0904292.1 Crp/Fnr family transcriptional regulator [Mariniflexile gromovii]